MILSGIDEFRISGREYAVTQMTQELIRNEFNKWADLGRGRGMEKSHWEITRAAVELMNIRSGDDIIDLGCGTGWATRVLAGTAPEGTVLGVDLADHMIQEAQTGYVNPPNAFFAVAEAASLPCPNVSFDSLLSVESIYYYPDLEGALGEAARILRPGGRAFLLINFYGENKYSHCWAEYLDVPVRLLGADEYVRLLENVGFRQVAHRRVSDPTPIPDEFQPSKWHPTREDLEGFQAEGALLLVAEK